MRWWSLFVLCLFLLSFSGNDTPYPKSDFIWPIDHDIRVSGTFGELRPNHFHSGIDLKSSRGGAGDRLHAASHGTIARIKVQAGGYGKALYIEHPNGYTTVYAHLLSFTEEIEAYVKEKQYGRESFEIDLYPTKDLFPVSQGDFIGKMGNSGSSQGAHLHFEIRDSRTEKPINPLLFGLDIPDRKPPRLHQLKIYEMDGIGAGTTERTYDLVYRNGRYELKADTLYASRQNLRFAIKAFDHHDNVSNWNGIYGMRVSANGSDLFHFDIESFSFDETRYINAFTDYEERINHRSYFYRCFRQPGNQLSFLPDAPMNGMLELKSNEAVEVKMDVYDVDGNEAELQFWVKPRFVDRSEEEPDYQYFLPHDEAHLIQTENCALHFPSGCLYDDLYLRYSISDDGSSDVFSDVYHVQDFNTPIHRYFDVAIKPDRELTPSERDKAFIAYCGKDGSVLNMGGAWEDNGMLHAKSNLLGSFSIMIDDRPPLIENVSFRTDMRTRSRMQLKISDNYSTGRHVDDLSFRATVDGKWILMEHDIKGNILTHRFDERIASGEHKFRFELTDAVGNLTVFERTFLK